MNESIYLSSKDLEYIVNNKKLVGKGTDGTVYRITNDICYKIYHHSEERNVSINIPIFDEHGVNIRNYKDLVYNKIYDITKYYDKDGVKLSREDALKKSIERQKSIIMSLLPKNVIYVDGRVMGCELKYINSLGSIFLSSYFPLFVRRKICQKILIKVKELTDNYIYPIDLCQKNENNIANKKDSNILLGCDLNPKLIDLDGKSTAYLEYYSKKYEEISLSSLSILIMELISSINFELDYDLTDLEYIKEILHDCKVSYELIDKFYDSYLNYNELNELIKTYKKNTI